MGFQVVRFERAIDPSDRDEFGIEMSRDDARVRIAARAREHASAKQTECVDEPSAINSDPRLVVATTIASTTLRIDALTGAQWPCQTSGARPSRSVARLRVVRSRRGRLLRRLLDWSRFRSCAVPCSSWLASRPDPFLTDNGAAMTGRPRFASASRSFGSRIRTAARRTPASRTASTISPDRRRPPHAPASRARQSLRQASAGILDRLSQFGAERGRVAIAHHDTQYGERTPLMTAWRRGFMIRHPGQAGAPADGGYSV